MRKSYADLSHNEQVARRRMAVALVLDHPEWDLGEAVRHLRRTLGMTAEELCALAKVSRKTLSDIENGASEGTVRTMNALLGVLGLQLGVVRRDAARRVTRAEGVGLQNDEAQGPGD